nr:oxygen-regulated protein 1-like [Syngnathus scovelli]
MNESGLRRIPPDQSSGSLRTLGSPRASVTDPILSKRVCFYKSGDPQFGGLRMVVNNRTFKTFDALLDSLSKKVPLPFGVRNITTPRGVHAINTLDELEDGKSYICSDNRKVKPINLALARKKLAPWYHARPVSSRRRNLQRARAFPGRQEPVLVHTPKRLVVFRNGDPSVKHTVVLQKRSTTTFEWILEYISEMMQFHVMKLHTADGRRVEGLPSLILCSGVVVAAGKEPFKPANYNVRKSSGSMRLPGNRMSVRRLKALNRKKKSPSYGSKSRNFSTSSERYIVNKIQNSLMESSCDLPSHPTNSIGYESGHVVAETEGDGLECVQPDEDDIEKSFRVNQDGSISVEMKVRLTVKEEEMLHWTTTLTRSSMANQLNVTSLPELESEKDVCPATLDSQDPISSNDTINKDESKDDRNDENPPSLGNGILSQSSYEEDVKMQSVCCSIKSIRYVAQSPSSLEMTNSVPDFSSHVASTFGSSAKVLLAFLSIVALKDSIANLNVDQVKANDVSCADALRMIESLKEIASMENSHLFEDRLSALCKSCSRQLLDSWRDFQELADAYQEENAIDDLIESLDIPKIIKEELVSLSVGCSSKGQEKLKANSEGCSSGMGEHNDELAYDDERQQELNPDLASHSVVEQCLEEEYENKPQEDGCYVELNPSRRASSETAQPETKDKMQSLDEEKGLNIIVQERISGQDEENKEELRIEMQDPKRDHPRDLADDDSGNDLSHDDHAESSALENEQIRSSAEEELKVSGSEEEQSYLAKYQAPVTDTKCETVEGTKVLFDEETSQPVAVRVSLLEKQVADAQKKQYNKDYAKKLSLLSEESIETFQQCSRSAPQSSLSFSYDSSGVVTVEPEGNRVKSIREMFLAKSFAKNAKQGLNAALPSGTSEKDGYQTQILSEQSSSEEDPVRKSISKGFVRRTIERLYGKTKAQERPPSAPRTKKKHSNTFLPFHTARCKAASELSYFNSTSALDTLTEATRCIAFNAQVGPGDSVPIDEGRWLIRENALIRKSISDPTGINTNLVNSAQDEDGCEDTQDDTPYSLFSTTSEPEEHKKSKMCTYFSLPHTSDSEVCQDEQSVLEAKSESGAKMRNGSAVGMADNKVHPLAVLPADGEAVVVTQPKKGHGMVNQSLQERDVLDVLYSFCGENCPIL